jgi:hypothetical protein
MKQEEIRIKYWNPKTGEQEYGTLIQATKLYYVVIPDVDIRLDLRWLRSNCEIINKPDMASSLTEEDMPF